MELVFALGEVFAFGSAMALTLVLSKSRSAIWIESEVAYAKELRKRAAYAKELRRAVVTFTLMLDVGMDRSSSFYTRPARARSLDRSMLKT